MLSGQGPHSHANKIIKGGYVVGEGVVAIPDEEDVGFFFFSKGDPCDEAGVVHLEARIVDGEVEVLKLPTLALHANLSRIVPTRVLWDKKLKKGVFPVRKVR